MVFNDPHIHILYKKCLSADTKYAVCLYMYPYIPAVQFRPQVLGPQIFLF